MFGKKKEKYFSLRIIKKKNIQLEHENMTESIYCSKNYNVTVSKNYNVYQSILYLLLSLF